MPVLGQHYVVTLDRLTDKGDGEGRLHERPLFVPGGLPQETLKIVLTVVKPNYCHGEIVEILQPSPDRCADFCAHTECGGCQLRPLSYAGQLQWKQAEVMAQVTAAGLHWPVPTLAGMDNPQGYRNKAVFNVSAAGEIGFYRKHSHDIVACDDCPMQAKSHAELLAGLRRWIEQANISCYNEQTHEGWLRSIMTRYAQATGQWLVVLVTTEGEFSSEAVAQLQAHWANLPLTTVVQNIHPTQSNRNLGSTERVLWGTGRIEDELCGLRFSLSAQSFYQNNATQTAHLYQRALTLAALQPTDTLFDVYCGIGTLGQCAASQVSQVIGIESIHSAVADAHHNAKLNGLTNTTYYLGKAESILPSLAAQGVTGDVALLDPPRKGCAPQLLATLCAMPGLDRIVYIACQPKSLLRDGHILEANGYRLRHWELIDMFPNSTHVEAVAVFERG